MRCHLMDTEQFTSPDEVKFKLVENFVESDAYSLFLCQCETCDQLYLGCFLRISFLEEEDDCWNFWLPVNDEDIELVRHNHDKGIELIQSRKRLVCNPVGEIYWNEGDEVALIMGPGILF